MENYSDGVAKITRTQAEILMRLADYKPRNGNFILEGMVKTSSSLEALHTAGLLHRGPPNPRALTWLTRYNWRLSVRGMEALIRYVKKNADTH